MQKKTCVVFLRSYIQLNSSSITCGFLLTALAVGCRLDSKFHWGCTATLPLILAWKKGFSDKQQCTHYSPSYVRQLHKTGNMYIHCLLLSAFPMPHFLPTPRVILQKLQSPIFWKSWALQPLTAANGHGGLLSGCSELACLTQSCLWHCHRGNVHQEWLGQQPSCHL